MDMQSYINAVMKDNRSKALSSSAQLTLGQIIKILEPMVNKERKQEADVYFDFEYIVPTTFDSWRGSYEELAVGFSLKERAPTLEAFYKSAKDCIGKVFSGYKGGEYIMSADTPVWVANYGNSGNTAIVGIRDDGYRIYLLTALCDFVL